MKVFLNLEIYFIQYKNHDWKFNIIIFCTFIKHKTQRKETAVYIKKDKKSHISRMLKKGEQNSRPDAKQHLYKLQYRHPNIFLGSCHYPINKSFDFAGSLCVWELFALLRILILSLFPPHVFFVFKLRICNIHSLHSWNYFWMVIGPSK